MQQNNYHILLDAKKEYTIQLSRLIAPRIYEGIKSIYNDAKKIKEQNNTETKGVLMIFQGLLKKIPKWSQSIIEKEFNRFKRQSNCEWIEEIIKAVFISHIKILTFIQTKNENKKMKFDAPPKGDYFIHRCYIETARDFWKNPYILYDIDIPQYDLQRNVRESEILINNAINETIRQMLPVKNILKEYLGNDNYDFNQNIESVISISHKNNLKKLVQKELENYQITETTDKKTSLNKIDNITDDNNKLQRISATSSLPTSALKVSNQNINLPSEINSENIPLVKQENNIQQIDIKSKQIINSNNQSNIQNTNLVTTDNHNTTSIPKTNNTTEKTTEKTT